MSLKPAWFKNPGQVRHTGMATCTQPIHQLRFSYLNLSLPTPQGNYILLYQGRPIRVYYIKTQHWMEAARAHIPWP